MISLIFFIFPYLSYLSSSIKFIPFIDIYSSLYANSVIYSNKTLDKLESFSIYKCIEKELELDIS